MKEYHYEREIRAERGDGNSLRLVGHAAVFNRQSEEIFGFREIVLPGAFSNALKKDDIRALWQHDPTLILGRNKSGTLRLREDDQGLRTEIDLPDSEQARGYYTSVKRGDVDAMSFGFRTVTDKWRKEDGVTIRELVEVELFDVSPVTYPAYPQTDISARSFYEARIRKEFGMAPDLDPQADAKAKAELEAQQKSRREFIAARTPKPDPLSYREILKHAKL